MTAIDIGYGLILLCKLVGCSLKISNLYLYIYFMPICFSLVCILMSIMFGLQFQPYVSVAGCIQFFVVVVVQDIPSQPWNLSPVKSKG